MYLTDVDHNPIDVDTDDSLTGIISVHSVEAAGTPYGHAIDMDPGCESQDGGNEWADYDLGYKWKSLSGTVALSEGTPTGAVGSFVISVDGSPKLSGNLTGGVPFPIKNLSVAGGYRLRLSVNDPNASARPCEGEPETDIIFGDIQLTN